MASLEIDDPLLTASRVVVVDACSTLDVIRIPVRSEWCADAESVEQTLAIAGDESALLLAIPVLIEAEYQKHRNGAADGVLNELRKHHNTVMFEAKFMRDMLKRCGLTAGELPAISLPADWADTLAGRFVSLAAEVHAKLTLVPHDPDDVVPAFSRVANSRAPAVQGAVGMNDSTLCEVALRIARQRPLGTTALLTSNGKDFRQAGSLHPQLVGDYDVSGLVDLPTWREALRFARAE